MARPKTVEDNEGPGESQEQLAQRPVQAIAATHAEAASNRVLQPRRVVEAIGSYNLWYAQVDPGVTQEDLERPSFWTHHTKILRRRDEIRVDCADGSFVAYLLVRAVGPKDVLVHVREFVELESVSPDALDIPSGYSIDWAGDIEQWRILRGREPVRGQFQTKAQAQNWLAVHIQSLQR